MPRHTLVRGVVFYKCALLEVVSKGNQKEIPRLLWVPYFETHIHYVLGPYFETHTDFSTFWTENG